MKQPGKGPPLDVPAGANEAASEPARRPNFGRPSLEEQLQGPVTCGWCETFYSQCPDSTNCANCGGPLPLPAGPDPGPEPPPPPRKLPRKFVWNLMVRQNFTGWFGVVFLSIPLLVAVFLISETIHGGDSVLGKLGFLSLFIVAGAVMVYLGFGQAFRRKKALQFGIAVSGHIEEVTLDQTVNVNNRHPYLVRYRFELGDTTREGKKSTFDAQVTAHYPGQPVWVVFVRDEPGSCAIWPPVA